MDTRAVQLRLLLADRMVSLGTLASGMAHEINNPLAFVMGNLDFLADEMSRLAKELRNGLSPQRADGLQGRLDAMMSALREARAGADRVGTIVRDLNTFSRGDEDTRTPVDVRHVLESAINIANNHIRQRARLLRDYREVPVVDANEARLGQVFLNLLMNAAQAIPEGQADRHQICVVTRPDDSGQVVVEFHDTGCGIAPEHLDRLFDPFFTTRPVGEGSGLGLSLCHGIVAAMGGQILVESRLGVGSIFRLVLPAASHALPPPPARTVRSKPHSGHVLVVEDDEEVAGSVRRLLASEHDVAVAMDPRQALADIKKGARYDVILCDLMMSYMTGMELHAELARVAPEQAARMVFLSGGAFTSRSRQFLASVANPSLEKPFEAAELRSVIRRCLDHAIR
jgi:nitrogen-specific signal transduction histidine kinase/CheY-like chemotaxis protein